MSKRMSSHEQTKGYQYSPNRRRDPDYDMEGESLQHGITGKERVRRDPERTLEYIPASPLK